MARGLLSAFNHKPINDLAMWMYIYHDEGCAFKGAADFMGMIAFISNLSYPGLRRSFAYNAGNYYIGENLHMIQHMLLVQYELLIL